MTILYKASNYGTIGTLDADISSSDTEFTVTGSSAKLPDLGINESYLIALGDPAGTREFVRANSFTTDTFSAVDRGFESSTNGGAAQSWTSGTPVTMIITSAYLDNIPQSNEKIIKSGAGSTTTGNGDLVTFDTPFTDHFNLTICESNAIGWGSPPSVTVYGYDPNGLTGFHVYAAQWSGTTFSYQGGLGYTWIAVGV